MRARRIKIFSLVLLSLLACIFGIQPKLHAQDTDNFSFDSFTADYRLTRAGDNSSRLDVQEELVARFPDMDQNHGILRAIPETYQDHTLSLDVLSVTNESGQPYNYTTYNQNDNLVLKIGDANRFVRGRLIYKIHYQMADVISFYQDHDEFFWDINGDQWPQSFESVAATIHIPAGLAQNLTKDQRCYAGAFGDQQQDCNISQQVSPSGTKVSVVAMGLSPYHTLSAAFAFKPHTFTKSQAVAREETLEKVSLLAGLTMATLLPLVVSIYMFRRWRQFGDDPKSRGVIVPQYEQPKGLDALTSDYLYKQTLRPEAISALLIELAVDGYIQIYEIPKKGLFGRKDYKLELKKLPEHTPNLIQKALKTVFADTADGSKIKISELKSNSSRRRDIYEQMKKLESDLAENLHSRGYFIKNPKAVKTGYQIWAGLVALAGAAAGWAAIATGIMAAGGLAAGTIIAALIIYLFSFIMPARSQKGVDDYDYLLGLKSYIKTAEAERLRYLQSPEGAEKVADKEAFNPKTDTAKIKLFEELLPYAMLFGLEKQWAKQFEGIYAKAPDWYHSDSAAFSAVYLGSSVGDFRSSSSSAFASPSSSGSGFGGGGAGGGGGGGGGGGW